MQPINETKIKLKDAQQQLKILLQLDPLVGDTACHILAVHLLFLYKLIQRQIQQTSPDQEEILLPVSAEYLNACLVLTQAKSQVRNGLGIITSEKTNYSAKVIEKIRSKTQKDIHIANLRAIVALTSFNFLKAIYGASTLSI